jgi:DNA-binding response OmpR family regulator
MPASGPAAAERPRPRILLVDDDRPVADALEEILVDDGYDVVKVYGAREALRATDEARFDLLLLDLAMPEMDGLALLGLLRLRGATEKLPVALITARPSLSDETLAHQGVQACFHKPFDVATFLHRVHGLCPV